MRLLKVISVFLAMIGLFAISTPLVNAAASSDDLYREQTTANDMMTKLGRGITNIFTGWIEIPKNIAKQWRETDPFTGFIVGGIKGIGWGFNRTIVGLYETVTFPFPIPKDYQPIMEPAYILPGVWGESLPIIEDARDEPKVNY